MKLSFSGDVTQALKNLKDKGVLKSPMSLKCVSYMSQSIDLPLLMTSVLFPLRKETLKITFLRMRPATFFSLDDPFIVQT